MLSYHNNYVDAEPRQESLSLPFCPLLPLLSPGNNPPETSVFQNVYRYFLLLLYISLS
ncbi:hypothetical protein QE443_003832 [Pantoea ananatis]|nr:hypothetical protein [Pantoea ananatis]MDR6090664.1 hypothetical protein [Pantoea ananatis]PWV65229.1 hypothetical protein C7425_10535 [Pantoea ananatis]CRH35629.1 hypothetical protein BN1184_AD_00350 [Pantoea ananatis]